VIVIFSPRLKPWAVMVVKVTALSFVLPAVREALVSRPLVVFDHGLDVGETEAGCSSGIERSRRGPRLTANTCSYTLPTSQTHNRPEPGWKVLQRERGSRVPRCSRYSARIVIKGIVWARSHPGGTAILAKHVAVAIHAGAVAPVANPQYNCRPSDRRVAAVVHRAARGRCRSEWRD
jgi:hypothetical protein